MAESNENIAKSCENPKENGVKLKENCKATLPPNGKCIVEAAVNGNSMESSKSIISQKISHTQPNKSLQASPHSSGCTKEASNINQAAPKVEEKSKTDSKSSNDASSKNRKRHDGHGKDTSPSKS